MNGSPVLQTPSVPCSDSSTLTAVSFAASDVCVLRGVRMPRWAFGFERVPSSLDVLGVGDFLQMGRFDTELVAAQMVDDKSISERPDPCSIGDSMGELHLVGAGRDGDDHSSVSFGARCCPSPQEAAIWLPLTEPEKPSLDWRAGRTLVVHSHIETQCVSYA